MSNIFFIGDLHFGHRNIYKFRPELDLETEEEHREFIISKWNSIIRKRDTVWVLGDACFAQEFTPDLDRLNGLKNLVAGNHDFNPVELRHHFNRVEGLTKYKGFWLSHAPIHPEELRNKVNIHGHVHSATLNDPRYINVSCENINYEPVSLETLRLRDPTEVFRL